MSEAGGYVYLMSYPGSRLLKIGFTRRLPRERAAEMGGTLAPATPKVEAAFRCADARLVESLTHRSLSHVRVNGEWFSVDLETASEVIVGTAAARGLEIEPAS